MTDIATPGAGVLFMKVGTHANESLEDIIKRKQAEIDAVGHALWGYGGNTCHPLTMVQPFAKDFSARHEPIYLCMEPMVSKHFAPPVRAAEFSSDGVHWEAIPDAINVRGSRFALAITELRDLREEEISLPLHHTQVAVGRSKGKRGDEYVSGRVDKACLQVSDPSEPEAGERPERVIGIGLTAKVIEPYAVFVRD